MANLRDVAARAGVSVATASRVANGSTRVRPHTRERVERAMRELLYVAPGRAPSTGAIGLLVPELENPVFPALAQAMEGKAARLGLASILCNTGGASGREADYVHMLLDRRVDGMIFISSEVTDLRSDHGHYLRLIEEGAKLVFVNGGAPALHVTSVGVDERAAGRLATEHLLALGHAFVAFAAGPEFTLPTREKRAGYEAALLEAGLEPEDELVAHAAFTVAGGRDAARALLTARPRPTGVICSNDLVAIGVLQEAAAQGLRVPEELSVVGFDGIAAAWTQPVLTTVEQPIQEIAETALAALRGLIDEPDVELPSFVFRPRLRPGGTSAPPSLRRSGARARLPTRRD
jgi:DNA-binding LacI/PurR family transcriptional regulator